MNVVDSCGWLEYFANGPNADFFEPALTDDSALLVPAITLFEVSRVLLRSTDSGCGLLKQVARASNPRSPPGHCTDPGRPTPPTRTRSTP